MGGKAQQRVAGNVKPSSSGRIRELLNNKHGTGKIITFSTLSNSNKNTSPNIHTKADQEADKQDIEATPPTAPPKDNQSPAKISPSPSSVPQTSPTDSSKHTLVVRRVGNRDLFARVRVAKDSADEETSHKDQFAVSRQSAGVFKPPEDLPSKDDSQKTFRSHGTNGSDHRDDEELGDQTGEVGSEEMTTPPENNYDFDTLIEKLAQIIELIESHSTSDLNELSQDLVDKEREVIKLLKILVENFKEDMSIEEWDLVVKSIYRWTNWITRAEGSSNTKFCIDIFDFILQLISLAKSLKDNEEVKDKFPLMQSLLEDWGNFHSSIVYQDLIAFYFKLAPMDNHNHEDLEIMEALAKIIMEVDPKLVISSENLSVHTSIKSEFDTEFELPEKGRYCDIGGGKFKGFLAICNHLRSNHRVVLVTAHSMLNRTMETICNNFQVSSVLTDQDDMDNLPLAPPAALMSILISRDSIMTALLSDFRVGDISVTMDPNSDAYTCALAYLFTWDLVVQFIVGMDKGIGHRIIHCLKKMQLIDRLLDNVFMLVPPLGEQDSLNFRMMSKDNSRSILGDRIWDLSNFLKSPLKTTLKRPVSEIELIALHIYSSVALHMPVTVRKWYNNNSNKRLCNLVREYTVKHISQVICSLEMDTVQEKCQERANKDVLDNLVIKARPTAKEVYAVYTRDEFRLELTIKLPLNYPLGPVQIDGGKRVGVTDLKWRSWLLQLTTFLSHQNGPILDGIDLWRKNIDKKFEGIEKCMICFSILHSNYQLPKKKCSTCRHMFHNICLYKWFETKGNSTCPLCRSIW